MRVVFMGTPQIAADVLETLAAHHEVVGVFCQPDKPVGRKQILTAPPVKETALRLGLPVFQPRGFKNGVAVKKIEELAPDAIAVIAYGKILPKSVLDIPRLGCVNLHGSLLPLYRGSAPIQRSVMDGVEVTGLTAMLMDEGMDTGDMLAVRELPLTEADDAASVYEKMGAMGGAFLCEVLASLEAGTAVRTKQDDSLATYAPPIEKAEGDFSFDNDAKHIVNKVRGLCIWPCASFLHEEKRIKVEKAAFSPQSGAVGEVLAIKPLTVGAKNGAVILHQVLPQGSRSMTGSQWAAGRRFKIGDNIFA